MAGNTDKRSARQQIFREMVLGTLVYSVVLGFFNDYTNILHTRSYSVTFAVALVMQVLTYLTFGLESRVADWFKTKAFRHNKAVLYLSVWLILFLSKFVFLEVIDFVFGNSVEISGFIGILLIVLAMTVTKELIDYIYDRLAD
jgi:hypothetical protein